MGPRKGESYGHFVFRRVCEQIFGVFLLTVLSGIFVWCTFAFPTASAIVIAIVLGSAILYGGYSTLRGDNEKER